MICIIIVKIADHRGYCVMRHEMLWSSETSNPNILYQN